MAAWDWVRKNSTKKNSPTNINSINNNHHNNNNHNKQLSDDNLTDLQNNNDIIELLNDWRNEKKNSNNNNPIIRSPVDETFQISSNNSNKQQLDDLNKSNLPSHLSQNIQLQPAPKILNHNNNNNSKFQEYGSSTIKQNIIPYDNSDNLNIPRSGSTSTTPNSDFSSYDEHQKKNNNSNFYQSSNSSSSSIERKLNDNNHFQLYHQQQPLNSNLPNKKLNFSVDNLKEEIILDLGLPRNKRGSNLSELTKIDNFGNEYNNEIAKQYYSKPRPLRKPVTRLSPSQASSRLKNLNNNKSSVQQQNPQIQKNQGQYTMRDLNKRTTSQRSPMRLDFQNSSSKQKVLSSLDINSSSNDYKVPQTPTVSNPFYKRQQSAINKFNNNLKQHTNNNNIGRVNNPYTSENRKENDNDDIDDDNEGHLDSSVSVSRNSSINSKLSNLDSPIRSYNNEDLTAASKNKPGNIDICRSNAPSVYIYNNHCPKNKKNIEGKDKLKINRTSSVYALEPVEDFKNIDMNKNPLPSIGNLLSSTEESFTIPDNPYALDTFNPYEYSK